MKKCIVVSVLLLYCTVITVLYVVKQQNNNVQTENAGIITLTSERQRVFKDYFSQHDWNFDELVFSGTTSLHMLSTDDWTTANELSKKIGLEGASSYNMKAYAFAKSSIPIAIGDIEYECILTPMAQTDDEKSKIIVFSCIRVDLYIDSDKNETFIYPVTITQEELITNLKTYLQDKLNLEEE